MKLIKLSEDGFVLKLKDNTTLVGNKLDVVLEMVDRDVAQSEIAAALGNFETSNHNVALFGINRTMIFTSHVTLDNEDPMESIRKLAV